MEQYLVTGMTCAACQNRVEKAVSKVPGVTACSVSLLTNSMGVEGTASPAEIIRAVTEAGYGAEMKGAGKLKSGSLQLIEEQEEALKDRETPLLRKRLIASLVFLIVLMYFSMGHMMLGFPIPAFSVITTWPWACCSSCWRPSSWSSTSGSLSAATAASSTARLIWTP